MTEQSARVRRSSTELRVLIIDAARDLFVERGFTNANTRDIAARASVTESVVFRHFRNKDEMFEAAVLSPFTTLMDEFVQQWNAIPHDAIDPVDHGREYIKALYELCITNRDLMRVMTTAHAESPLDGGGTALTPLEEHLTAMQKTLEGYLAVDGGTMIDLGLALKLTMALVLGSAVFDQELFGDGTYPRAELPDHVMNFILYGINYRSVSGGQPAWLTQRDLSSDESTER